LPPAVKNESPCILLRILETNIERDSSLKDLFSLTGFLFVKKCTTLCTYCINNNFKCTALCLVCCCSYVMCMSQPVVTAANANCQPVNTSKVGAFCVDVVLCCILSVQTTMILRKILMSSNIYGNTKQLLPLMCNFVRYVMTK
jgi:hypothetical protein